YISERGVDSEGTEVDQARDVVACEQDVIVMNVPDCRLQSDVRGCGERPLKDAALYWLADQDKQLGGPLMQFPPERIVDSILERRGHCPLDPRQPALWQCSTLP